MQLCNEKDRPLLQSPHLKKTIAVYWQNEKKKKGEDVVGVPVV